MRSGDQVKEILTTQRISKLRTDTHYDPSKLEEIRLTMLAASSTLSQEATTDHAVQDLVAFASQYSNYFPPRPSPLRSRPIGKDVVLVTGTTGNFGCELLESLLLDNSIRVVYAINRRGTHASDRQRAMFRAKDIDESLLGSPKLKLIEGDLGMFEMGLEDRIYNEVRLLTMTLYAASLTRPMNRYVAQ